MDIDLIVSHFFLTVFCDCVGKIKSAKCFRTARAHTSACFEGAALFGTVRAYCFAQFECKVVICVSACVLVGDALGWHCTPASYETRLLLFVTPR